MPAPPAPGRAAWSLMTPGASSGAVAIVQITGDVGWAMRVMNVGEVPVGGLAVRDLLGVDRGVVARWSEGCLHLMPHAGVAVVRAITGALTARGLGPAGRASARERYPEASSEIEARMLAALATAASADAIDLLLAQPARWSVPGAASDPARDVMLSRLIHPALVVGVGAANIGKSSLLNALAGRTVALVADEPGTTRDHVGAMLDLHGLVVRYVDTPGLRESRAEIEAEAARLALEVAASADLLLVFEDAASPAPALGATVTAGPASRAGVLRAALRRDLGPPRGPVDLEVCVRSGQGLDALARAIRERLVPSAAVAHDAPWRFWDDGPAAT